MQSNTPTIQDDEIDLRELWATLVKRKLTILAITVITAACAVLYVYTTTPVYKGDVLIELGEVIINSETINDKPTIIQTIDNPTDLKEAILQIMTANDKGKQNSFSVEAPKGSSKLVKISYEDTDKQHIKQILEDAVSFVLQRHESKAEFFQKANAHIHPSNIIDSINIAPDPIKPKKQLIIAVAFISGLMLGIFAAFFIEFISNGRKADEIPEMNKE